MFLTTGIILAEGKSKEFILTVNTFHGDIGSSDVAVDQPDEVFLWGGEDYVFSGHLRKGCKREVGSFKNGFQAVVVIVGAMQVPAFAVISSVPFAGKENIHGKIEIQGIDILPEMFNLVEDVLFGQGFQSDEIDVGVPGDVLIFKDRAETVHGESDSLSGAVNRGFIVPCTDELKLTIIQDFGKDELLDNIPGDRSCLAVSSLIILALSPNKGLKRSGINPGFHRPEWGLSDPGNIRLDRKTPRRTTAHTR